MMLIRRCMLKQNLSNVATENSCCEPITTIKAVRLNQLESGRLRPFSSRAYAASVEVETSQSLSTMLLSSPKHGRR